MADKLIATNSAREAVYTAAADQTDFAVSWHYEGASEMGVKVTDAEGVVTYPAFSMVPASSPSDTAPPYSAILRLDTGLAGGERVEVYGATPFGRKTSLTEKKGNPSTVHNTEYTNLSKQIQEIGQKLGRAVLARRGEALPELPDDDAMAGGVVYLKADKSGWLVIPAEYVAALGEDLAEGAGSAIELVGANIVPVVAAGDEISSIVLLAPIASKLAYLADNFALLEDLANGVSLPELTVV